MSSLQMIFPTSCHNRGSPPHGRPRSQPGRMNHAGNHLSATSVLATQLTLLGSPLRLRRPTGRLSCPSRPPRHQRLLTTMPRSPLQRHILPIPVSRPRSMMLACVLSFQVLCQFGRSSASPSVSALYRTQPRLSQHRTLLVPARSQKSLRSRCPSCARSQTSSVAVQA